MMQKYLYMMSLLMTFFNVHGHENSLHPEETGYLLALVEKLEANENIIFTKFGDGEYNCMIGRNGSNSDGDYYTAWLRDALHRSVIGLAKKPNTYIGRWGREDVPQYLDNLARAHAVTIPWTCYHLILNHDVFLNHDYMYKFVKFIVNSTKKKILICNTANSRLKEFFRADILLNIPNQNWSNRYHAYKDVIASHAEDDCIMLIAGGMCSKVLINDITDEYNLTFIDLGSGFDLLGSKIKSRPWQHSYEDEVAYYKDFIPGTWDA